MFFGDKSEEEEYRLPQDRKYEEVLKSRWEKGVEQKDVFVTMETHEMGEDIRGGRGGGEEGRDESEFCRFEDSRNLVGGGDALRRVGVAS